MSRNGGGGMVLLQVPATALGAGVPKHGCTLEEVIASYGSKTLVQELRGIGALRPAARRKQALLFDAAEVARVWAEFCGGRYDGQLEEWQSAMGRG